MHRSLLIYDDSRPGFGVVGDLLARSTADCTAIPWDDPSVQSFLDAQFDDHPFAFILVKGETVYVGEDAVERLVLDTGIGDPFAGLAGTVYQPFAGPFGRLVHGRRPDDVHGTYELTEEAAAHIEDLRRSHTIPVTAE